MMIRSKLILSVTILLLIIVLNSFGYKYLFYYVSGFFYGYNSNFEYKITKAIDIAIQNKEWQTIELQTFSDKKIVKACVQSPYIPQADFELRIGEKVSNFKVVDDTWGYVLWLFFSDNSTAHIRTGIHKKDNTSICTKKLMAISVKKIADTTYFYFL
ncbi:MAG: hypothetical protein NTV43_16655 [Methylococcales bacterium]|nr:hypothetical protein [Methylococcales bacterium]